MVVYFNYKRHFDWLFTYTTNTFTHKIPPAYIYRPDSNIRNSIAFLIANPRDLIISRALPAKSITI